MNQLVASKIVRSRSVKKAIASRCSVCNGFIFNAKRYMRMDDAYFTSNQVTFPLGAKRIFLKIMHVLQQQQNNHHFALDLDQLGKYLNTATYKVPQVPFQ